MEKVEENFGDLLLRLNFIFKNETLTTECIKDHPGKSLLGENYGPFEKSKQYKLKFFIAIPFIVRNYLKVIDIEKCDNINVMNYAVEERDDQSLIRRDSKNFLNKVKEFKLFMEKEVDKNLRPADDLKRYKSYYANIIDSRLSKLLRLAKVNLSLNDEQKLTTSELVLFHYLSRIIKVWRLYFLSNH
ncbi:MAG: hypothetical protein P8Y23_01175 [Candidatus Lokiarchaeota archaeon]